MKLLFFIQDCVGCVASGCTPPGCAGRCGCPPSDEPVDSTIDIWLWILIPIAMILAWYAIDKIKSKQSKKS